MIISDYDKTLTDTDTLLGFYLLITKRSAKIFLLPLYIFGLILAKVKIITNTTLKQLGVFLFIKGLNLAQLEGYSKAYGKSIKLNSLALTLIKEKKNVLVITASFEEYVKYSIPENWNLEGSKLKFENKIVVGLHRNLYGERKGELLSDCHFKPNSFEVFYTDSFSDKSVFKFAKKVTMVKK